MKNVSRKQAIGMMTIGIFIELVIFVVSFAFFDSDLHIVYPAAPFIIAGSMLAGVFPTVFLVIDLSDLLNYSESADKGIFILLMFSAATSTFAISILSILFQHSTFPPQYIFLLISFHGPVYLGLILYFLGRPILVRFNEEIVERRRRGKRSPIKKDDIIKMDSDGEFEKLCDVLSSDVNFRNRELAAGLLSRYNNAEVTESLKSSLLDDEHAVKLASSLSLLKLDSDDGRAIIEETWIEGHKEDRIRIVKILKAVDEDWAISILKRAKDDDDEEVRKFVRGI